MNKILYLLSKCLSVSVWATSYALVKVYLNIEANKEVLKDYKAQIEGTVFIGRRSGFLDDDAIALKELETLGEGYPQVKMGSINEIIAIYSFDEKAILRCFEIAPY